MNQINMQVPRGSFAKHEQQRYDASLKKALRAPASTVVKPVVA